MICRRSWGCQRPTNRFMSICSIAKAHVRSFFRDRYPDFPKRRAFFVETDTQLAVYAQWGDRVAEDLRHEVAHGYLHAIVPSIPLWLDEGLAEYFEVPRGQNGLNRTRRRSGRAAQGRHLAARAARARGGTKARAHGTIRLRRSLGLGPFAAGNRSRTGHAPAQDISQLHATARPSRCRRPLRTSCPTLGNC